jgi:hypothetical protein
MSVTQKEIQPNITEQKIAEWLKLIAIGQTDDANAVIDRMNQISLSRKCPNCGGHIHHELGCSLG